MSQNKITVTLDARKMSDELLDLVDRVYKEKPDPKDVRALRKKLDEIPDLWKAVFDITKIVRDNFIQKAVSSEAAGLATEKNVDVLMDELGYGNSSSLEKILIDNVVISWLGIRWAEYEMLGFMGQAEVRMSVVAYWEKRLSMAQARHLRACETLARVRKLMSTRPALQVNIAAEGGQQVNVAGDLVKN